MEGGFAGLENFSANPLFIDADGPDNIPGTEDDNLRLALGSPAIDRGDNASVPIGLISDADGLDRFIDGDGDTFVDVDLGAYEFDGSTTVYIFNLTQNTTSGRIVRRMLGESSSSIRLYDKRCADHAEALLSQPSESCMFDHLRVEQEVLFKYRPYDAKNPVFRMRMGDPRTRYGGATLALVWRYAGLTGWMTPNRHQIRQRTTSKERPSGENSRTRVQNVPVDSTEGHMCVRKS